MGDYPISWLAPGVKVGITEATIHSVVQTFYARVRLDPVLGPAFNRLIARNWDTHVSRMCDFWAAVLLMKRTPVQAHVAIGGLGQAHFERRLQIFKAIVEDVCSKEAAELFIRKAEMIARSPGSGVVTLKRPRQAFPPQRLH